MTAKYPDAQPDLKTTFADNSPHHEELLEKGLNQPNLETNAIAGELGTNPKDAAEADPGATASSVKNLLGQFKKKLRLITGESSWYDSAVATLASLWAKFHATTGHGHTGAANDAPLIDSNGLASGSVIEDRIGTGAATENKIGSGAVTENKIGTGAVTVNKIGSAAVDGTKLATNAITLGYAQITTGFTTTTVASYVDVTGLSVAVTVPAGGRKAKITAYSFAVKTSGAAGTNIDFGIFEGATQLGDMSLQQPISGYNMPGICIAVITPTAGAHTYKVAVQQTSAGTLTVAANASAPVAPAFILVELI